MPLPICNVRSEGGIVRTNTNDSYNVLVEAYQQLTDGDITRVDFGVSSNGGASSTTSVSSRAMWFPDDTIYDDPLPNVVKGKYTTLEVYDDPGTSSWASTRYTATVEGQTAYVYGYTRTVLPPSSVWTQGDSVEMSWFTYGADGTVDVTITAISGPVTSVTVYPGNIGLEKRIENGKAILSIPTNTRIWVEINGDRKHVLMIFSSPLKEAVSASYIDWTTAGSPSSWLDTVNQLYFPAGVHTIGQLFELGSNTSVYLDGGAVVIGTFDLRGSDGVTIKGPGVLAGSFEIAENTVTLPFLDFVEYAMFLGYDGSKFVFDNTVQGLTVVAPPGYFSYFGVNRWTNVNLINPWCWGTGQFDLSARTPADRTAYATDCFTYNADDGIVTYTNNITDTISGCFFVSVTNSCYNFGYNPVVAAGKSTLIKNCYAMHMGIADSDVLDPPPFTLPGPRGVNTIFKFWSDGDVGQESYGRFNVTIKNMKVCGPILSRVFSLYNRTYPVTWGTQYSAIGQMSNWLIDGLEVENVPGQVSIIEGKDAVSTPHDITFTNFTIAGIPVISSNYSTYVSVNSYPYNITFNTKGSVIDDQIVDAGGLYTYTWTRGPSPIWCYGLKVNMSSYAVGYIDVTPTVVGGSGSSVVLETIRIYNDKDGTDRRPSPKIIFFDYINGNDANTGLATGSAVKTFQKACELAATSNDMGGATIIIDSEGEHVIGSSNNYSYGTNLYTSGQHWLTVKPRTGLNRENITLVKKSDFDGDWMTFVGTTPGQEARLRFSDVTICNPGFNLNTSSSVTIILWLDHVLSTAPAPYNHTYNNTQLHVRAIESGSSGPIGINSVNATDQIHATGTTRKLCFNIGSWAKRTRGCLFEKVAGAVYQFVGSNGAHTNIMIKDIYQEYGVAGCFPLFGSGQLHLKSMGGNRYRVQSLNTYYTDPFFGAGSDIAVMASYTSGSTYLGILLQDFPTASNNNTCFHYVSGGYSGIYPYVEISGAGITPEISNSGRIINGKLSDPTNTYSVWGPHSDIVQFWSGPNNNNIFSNVGVFPAWATQGIYGSTQDISGFALVNYFDGPSSGYTSGPRSYYTYGSYNKHIVIRNSFISNLELSSTQTNEDIEMTDNAFGRMSMSAGSMSAYTGIADIRYNHYIDNTQVPGTNMSSGATYFSSTTPGISIDANVSNSSLAKGTASSLWSRPTTYVNDKGPWRNITSGNWSLPTTTATASSTVYPDPIVSVSIVNDVTTTKVNRVDSDTPVIFSSSDVYSVACIIILEDEDPPISAFSIPSPTVITGTGTIVSASGYGSVALSLPTIQSVYTENNPTQGGGGETQGGQSFASGPGYSSASDATQIVIKELVGIEDFKIVPILVEMSQVNNNIARVPDNSKLEWSQKILDNPSLPTASRAVINIMTTNYHKFTTVKNKISARTTKKI